MGSQVTFFLEILSRVLNAIPRFFLLVLADGIGWLWFHVVRFRRDVVLENLRGAFSASLDEPSLRRLALRNFQHYVRTALETLQSVCWTKEDYRRKLVVEGLEHARRYIDAGQGCFFLTLHLGNWEQIIGMAVANGIPLDILAKPPRDRRANALFHWYRAKTGATLLSESGSAKDILRAIARGRFVGFSLDQFMGPPIGLPVKFFGREAGTAAALALLTERRDIPILPGWGYRDREGVNHLVFEKALEVPEFSQDKDTRLFEKTQFFNDVLEDRIRRYPEQWLWLHRRWKPFRGESRWKLPEALAPAALALAILLTACSSVPSATPTGIALPPDPSVGVPVFKAPESPDAAEGEKPAPTPEPMKLTKPQKKKKKQMEAEATPTPGPTPQPSPFDTFTSDRIPFLVGEHMEMELNWMALPAGRVVLEVRPGQPFNGRPTYHLWGNALSSRLVDTIYHVDNTIESIIDAAGLVPYKFLLHMVETHQKKETRVAFDHTKKKAYYWAKRVSEKWGPLDQDRADDIVGQPRDMFSALYYARTLNYKLNETQSFAIYENNQNLVVELTPVANEFVNTKVGAFQCWKLKVTVKLDNVLRPTGDLYMWLSDDSKKYIVKFDAKIKIGSLYGNLSSIREK